MSQGFLFLDSAGFEEISSGLLLVHEGGLVDFSGATKIASDLVWLVLKSTFYFPFPPPSPRGGRGRAQRAHSLGNRLFLVGSGPDPVKIL